MITVILSDGSKLLFEPTSSVGMLERRIFSRTGISVSNQQLFRENFEVSNPAVRHSVQLSTGDVIHLVKMHMANDYDEAILWNNVEAAKANIEQERTSEKRWFCHSPELGGIVLSTLNPIDTRLAYTLDMPYHETLFEAMEICDLNPAFDAIWSFKLLIERMELRKFPTALAKGKLGIELSELCELSPENEI